MYSISKNLFIAEMKRCETVFRLHWMNETLERHQMCSSLNHITNFPTLVKKNICILLRHKIVCFLITLMYLFHSSLFSFYFSFFIFFLLAPPLSHYLSISLFQKMLIHPKYTPVYTPQQQRNYLVLKRK